MRWTQQEYEAYLARRAQAGAKIPAAEPERDQAPTLDSAAEGKEKSMGLPAVSFVFFRYRLLDRDNSWASAKDLLDGCTKAGLIEGDSEKQINLQVSQVKVANRADQKTVIEITYP